MRPPASPSVVAVLALAGCAPTPTSKVRDAAQVIVTQLPNSSAPESASKWIRDFEKSGQTGTGTGNILAPTWYYGLWSDWGPSSAAYTVTSARSKVALDIALLAIGPGQAGLTGKTASSYMCVHVVLTPGRHAEMTNASCPMDVRERASAVAPYSMMVTFDGDLHADAGR